MGIVAFYVLLAVEVTSLLKPRIGRTWWRRTHYLSFALFAFSTVHAVMAGTDTRSGLVLMALAVVSLPVFALAGVRLGVPALPARTSRSGSAVVAAERRLVQEPRPDLPQRDPQTALTRAP